MIKKIILDLMRDFSLGDTNYEVHYWKYPSQSMEIHCHFLAGMAAMADGAILEIGADTGLSTMALGYGTKLAYDVHKSFAQPVYSFEPVNWKIAKIQKRLDEHGLDHVRLIHGTSADILKIIDKPEIGLAYIDGSHSYENCLADLVACSKVLGDYGKILVHDMSEPRLAAGRIDVQGVTHACLTFLRNYPQFQAASPGNPWLIISKSRVHPMWGWDIEAAEDEIRRRTKQNRDTPRKSAFVRHR